ncbi:phosphate ABC transporter substrate-binding/OmpA family protein [Pseudomonas sp. GD03944]|uniref:phosphate ABC transporter substrate-binding/OmpA family protein n=1 Tax=Pseudomonas sp. GD03944 TaxID=2975409 RepID=UPI002447927F|nr:phosphate ABC transporter substrate-binding/OmpA family protein [Pseudomonas sp. GD03944]MDH1263738.1 phosphate ABC transporter substrate-binding/OmpA family protein [Pseudomonas sp. GD03944]
MPRALPADDQETWSRTLTFLILGFICYALPWSVFADALPTPTSSGTVLHIQGSNTIGARLGPALIKGMLEEQGLSDIRIEAGAVENEQQISGRASNGRRVVVTIAAHGSGTGFTGLRDGSADLAASSRPIKDAEASALASLGDLKSAGGEQIIAIDGLAIILHPSNPIVALRIDQLAQIFSGEVTDWSQLGGNSGRIRLYARDDNSGTYDTFKELVLSAHGKALAPSAQRFESSEKLSDGVSQDPQGIGFIGLPYIRQAKAVSIAAGDSLAMAPLPTLVATEDYPLSRRLFIYIQPQSSNAWARELVRFTHSPRGQAIVGQNGFIAQTVQAVNVAPNNAMPPAYLKLANEAQRLTVNFRFQEGSASLDNKAQRDLERVMSYLQSQDKLQNKVVLVGFGDPKGDPGRAELLSKLRAMAVRRELAKQGVLLREVVGFGDELPVAANDGDDGRIKNRRVEVWVY